MFKAQNANFSSHAIVTSAACTLQKLCKCIYLTGKQPLRCLGFVYCVLLRVRQNSLHTVCRRLKQGYHIAIQILFLRNMITSSHW